MSLSTMPPLTIPLENGYTKNPTESPTLDFDVVVVGGGIVGLTMALAIAPSSLRIALVESSGESIAARRGQAYNISPRSAQIFHQLGIWGDLLPRITPYEQIRLSDGDYGAVVQFKPQDLGLPKDGYLGCIAPHGVLLTQLESALGKTTIRRFCPVTVTNVSYLPQQAVLTLQSNDSSTALTLTSQLVIGADGAHSPLRRSAGIHTFGWRYPQACVVATIQSELYHQRIAYERFWPSGPFAVLPMDGGRCRIVWTAPYPEAESLLRCDPQVFIEQLHQRFGAHLGKVTLEDERVLLPVELMHSDHYVLHRLALIGDAAHRCHPVGGQGLNLGLRDVAVLREVLLSACHKGNDIGDLSTLRHFDHRSRVHNLMMLAVTDGLVKLFSNQWLPFVALRRLGLNLMRAIPMIRHWVLRLMTGCYGQYQSLSLWKSIQS